MNKNWMYYFLRRNFLLLKKAYRSFELIFVYYVIKLISYVNVSVPKRLFNIQIVGVDSLHNYNDSTCICIEPEKNATMYGYSMNEEVIQPALRLWKLKDCIVSSYSDLFFDGNSIYTDKLSDYNFYPILKQESNYIKGKIGNKFLITTPNIKIRETTALVLTAMGSANYYHFLTEVFSKLFYIIKYNLITEPISIVLDEEVYNNKNFRNLLVEILEDKISSVLTIKTNENFQFKFVYYLSDISFTPFFDVTKHKIHPSMSLFRKNVFTDLQKWIIERSLKYTNSSLSFPKKIFIGRRSAFRGYNQAEVFSFLESYGFTMVYPEDYSIFEQVQLFNNADFVAGASGAAMTNILFGKPKSKWLIWIPDNLAELACFPNLANCSQVNINHLRYKSKDDGTYKLDVNILKYKLVL